MKEKSQKKAILWSATERFSSQGIQFIIGIIIARLLDPACYGIVAMLYIFLAVGQSLIDSGFASALIQKKNCTDIDYCTVFYFNMVVSVFLYLIACLCSPLIAFFYNQPELEAIVKISTLVFVINALAIVQRAKLTKNMDFRSQTLSTLIAVSVSGVLGIILAYSGAGVWSLVTQSLLNAGVNTLMLWYYSRWKPTLFFSKASFNELFAFGFRMMLTGLITTIYNNLYTLIIGKFYKPIDLGYYNRMQQMAAFPSKNLTTIIARAVYPKQCKMQDDNQTLLNTYLKLLAHSSFIVFPLMFGLSALAHPLVLVLLGEKWGNASVFLTILCLAYCFDHIQYFNWQILSVKGRSDLSLKSEILKKGVSILILVLTIPLGIKAMLWGMVLYALVDVGIIIPFVHKVMPEINYLVEIKVIILPLIFSIMMYAGIVFVNSLFLNNYIQLLIGCLLGIIIYLGFSNIFHLSSWIYFKKIIFQYF